MECSILSLVPGRRALTARYRTMQVGVDTVGQLNTYVDRRRAADLINVTEALHEKALARISAKLEVVGWQFHLFSGEYAVEIAVELLQVEGIERFIVSAEETIRRWPSVRRGEEKWIFPFQENADAMFNSSLLFELGVIKDYAENVRFSHQGAVGSCRGGIGADSSQQGYE
mgnify:CR=1 FL=1